jgi:hypothetical protein
MSSHTHFSGSSPFSRSARKGVSNNSAACSPTLNRPIGKMNHLAWAQPAENTYDEILNIYHHFVPTTHELKSE